MDPLTLPIARPGRLLTPVVVYDGHDAPQVPPDAGYGYLFKKADDPALYWTTSEYGEVQISLGYGYGNIGGPQQATHGGIAMFADNSGDLLVSSQLAIDENGRLTIAGHHVFGATEHGTVIGREAGGSELKLNYAENTIIGYRAAHLLESAAKNVIMGQEAAYNMATGQKNTIVGYQAAMGCSASFNTVIGAQSRGSYAHTAYATAVGYDAQASWQGVALGAKATADQNAVAIGYQAQAATNTAHIAVQRFKTGIPSEISRRVVYLSQAGHLVCDPLHEDIQPQTDLTGTEALNIIKSLVVKQATYDGQSVAIISGQPRLADVIAQCVATIQYMANQLNL